MRKFSPTGSTSSSSSSSDIVPTGLEDCSTDELRRRIGFYARECVLRPAPPSHP